MYRGSGGGRINERDVPESQHTVFIRGLPGNMSTDEIREFFEKDFGSCTFDFVKVSPDRSKLYVAVRFDSKAAAREVMERFSPDGDLIGYKVEMTWFRDIRRYLAHCAKQGIRPSRFRGRGDSRRDDDRHKGRGRSRSPTRSPEHEEDGRSRSASIASRHSHAGNERRSLSHSRSVKSHSRSRSLSPGAEGRGARDGHASHSEREKSLDYSDIDEQKKEGLSPPRVLSPSPPPLKKSKKEKRRKEKRQRRSKHFSPSLAEQQHQPYSGSQSDMEIGGEEVEGVLNGGRKMLKLEATSPVGSKIFIGPVKPIVQQLAQKAEQPSQMIQSSDPSTFYQRHLTAGAVVAGAANDSVILTKTEQMQQQMATTIQNQQQISEQKQMMPKVELRNQSIMLDLSDPKIVSPPKFKPIGELSDYQQLNGTKEVSNFRMPTPPPQPPPMLRNIPVPPAAAAANDFSSAPANFFLSAPIHEPGMALNNFREIQCAIMQDVRYKAPEKEENMGTIRLTSLSRKGPTEEKRGEKMAKLAPELRERVNEKKRELEKNYRSDCEAYGLVVNKLIAKDRALEGRLKFLLLETMKDLEAETVKQLDEFLDQLISFCA